MSAAPVSLQEANDFSRLEPQIVALLQAAVAPLHPAVHVLTASDLQTVKDAAQRAPALHVVSNGFAPIESQYKAARLRHTWYVVAVVRNQAGQKSAAPARRDAGALLALAMGALLSEPLAGAATPLAPAPAPAGVHVNGFYYLPSGWQIESVFRKP